LHCLKFEKRAGHDFEKLEANVYRRIWDKLQEAKLNPLHFFEKLTESDYFKLRIGDWRVMVDIDDSTKTITVLKVGHRRNVYD